MLNSKALIASSSYDVSETRRVSRAREEEGSRGQGERCLWEMMLITVPEQAPFQEGYCKLLTWWEVFPSALFCRLVCKRSLRQPDSSKASK